MIVIIIGILVLIYIMVLLWLMFLEELNHNPIKTIPKVDENVKNLDNPIKLDEIFDISKDVQNCVELGFPIEISRPKFDLNHEKEKTANLQTISSNNQKRENIRSFLINPNKHANEIFVPLEAVNLYPHVVFPSINGDIEWKDVVSTDYPVKLFSAGTGFLVYNCPEVPDGKWFSCR